MGERKGGAGLGRVLEPGFELGTPSFKNKAFDADLHYMLMVSFNSTI